MQRWSLMKPSFMFLYLQVSPNLEPAPSLPPAPSTIALLQTAQKNLSQSDDGSSLKQNSTVNSTIDLVVSSNSSDADRDTATPPPQAGELDTFTVSFISIFCATHFIQTRLFWIVFLNEQTWDARSCYHWWSSWMDVQECAETCKALANKRNSCDQFFFPEETAVRKLFKEIPQTLQSISFSCSSV